MSQAVALWIETHPVITLILALLLYGALLTLQAGRHWNRP